MLRLVVLAACAAAVRAACDADDIKVKKPEEMDNVYVRDEVTVKWEITDADCDDEFSTVQIQLCPDYATASDVSACGDFVLDPTDQTGASTTSSSATTRRPTTTSPGSASARPSR